jgi:hypothetical protein
VIRPVSTGLPAPVQRGLAAPQTDAPAVGGRAVGTRSGARSGGGSMASAYQAKDYGRCLAIASRLEASGRLDSRSALQKGWCLMGLDRPQEAALAFTQARGTAATAEDAAYGEALARLRNGQSSEAAMAANGAALAPQKRNEIGVAVLAQRAAAAFDAGQYRSTLEILNQRRLYVGEPRDLSVLRGWSLYHLGYREDAQKVFGTLDAQLSTKDTRTGLAVSSQRKALREDK